MILSHRHKFIFIKTVKTAGTSIEFALGNQCGPDDIITYVRKDDEDIRAGLGFRGPQNYVPPFRSYSLRDWWIALRRRKRKRFENHMAARDIRLLVGEKIWNSYYKFCFERNPWDRTVSLYWWRGRGNPKKSLSEFIAAGVPRDLTKLGMDLYLIDGEVAVDRICRYENLAEELEYLRERLRLPEPIVLPRIKGEFRKDRRHYREVLGPHDRDLVASMSQRQIEAFQYAF